MFCLVFDREGLLPGLRRQRAVRWQSLLRLLQVLPPQVCLPTTHGETIDVSGASRLYRHLAEYSQYRSVDYLCRYRTNTTSSSCFVVLDVGFSLISLVANKK